MTDLSNIFKGIDVNQRGLSPNEFADTHKGIVDNISPNNIIDKKFTDDAFCLSNYLTEVYAHQGYINIVGEYIYCLYMCNDGTYDINGNLTIGSGEGEVGQLIRMSRVHFLNHTDRTFYDVAKQNETYSLITNGVESGSVTLQNFRLQGHQAYLLSDGFTIRCFMTGLIYGESQYFFRDFNTKTNTLGGATLVRLYPKLQIAWVLFNRTTVYDHFDWFLAGSPSSGTYPANALGDTILDYMLGTIKKMFNNSWYCVVNVGTGSGNRAGAILMRSTDQGVNWFAETCFNPLLLNGITGVDKKFLWEGVVVEDSTNYYAILRGAGDGLAAGLYKATIPKTNIKTNTVTKLLNTSNEKVCVFYAYSRYYMINPEFNKYFGPLNSNRTVEALYQFDASFSTATRLFGFSDANGCHTWDVNNLKETPYGVFSSSKLRKAQIRSGQPYYANTSEIWCKRIKGEYLVQ